MYMRLIALIAFVVFACLIVCSPALSRAPLPNFTGHYEYRSIPYDFELDVLQQGQSLSGVFKIKILLHTTWRYTFKGRIRPNGVITAHHHDGSRFVGILAHDNSRINGMVTHRTDEVFRVGFDRPKKGWGGDHSQVGVRY